MLSLAVVALNPGHDDAVGLLEGLKMMQPDTFLLQGQEELLDHPVVLRRGAGDELLGDRELLSGTDKEPGQEDGPVVVYIFEFTNASSSVNSIFDVHVIDLVEVSPEAAIYV